MEDTRAGLQKVLDEVPVGRGYARIIGAYSSLSGPLARGEVGWRPRSNLGVYGFGQWTPRESSAGIGAQLRF